MQQLRELYQLILEHPWITLYLWFIIISWLLVVRGGSFVNFKTIRNYGVGSGR
jgi:putative exporter of polyketide antibiotics